MSIKYNSTIKTGYVGKLIGLKFRGVMHLIPQCKCAMTTFERQQHHVTVMQRKFARFVPFEKGTIKTLIVTHL